MIQINFSFHLLISTSRSKTIWNMAPFIAVQQFLSDQSKYYLIFGCICLVCHKWTYLLLLWCFSRLVAQLHFVYHFNLLYRRSYTLHTQLVLALMVDVACQKPSTFPMIKSFVVLEVRFGSVSYYMMKF